jgi:hypothetical protein
VLGSVQRGTNTSVRQGAKESSQFCTFTDKPNWEPLASHRNLSCICAPFKAYCGEGAWKIIRVGHRLQRPHYLSRVDHERKIRNRRQRTDIGKYWFVNRTIQHCNKLPADVLETLPCKQITFKKRVRKSIIEMS